MIDAPHPLASQIRGVIAVGQKPSDELLESWAAELDRLTAELEGEAIETVELGARAIQAEAKCKDLAKENEDLKQALHRPWERKQEDGTTKSVPEPNPKV